MSETPTPIDMKTFWRTLGERATGMTVVTAAGDDGPAGFLGLSAAHVTADPPTMLVSVDAKTSALGPILAKKHFAVNFLPAEAGHVADAFSGKGGLSGADRFVAGEWGTIATGAPTFTAALGVFDCVVEQVIERGSISIVIGTVVGAHAAGTGEPLLFFRGKTIAGLTPAA
ncbi:flavin reductase family protein [Ancylobacter sp. 6x-1]|uniref:Flavin reductase family protein n=1 Tax=Ancylobacter crimeensis TaxID=2579147 RepID=A0ABT0DFZ2_9HYPH|nr:flavin reductase family protein [Ancylobacter crimeensis]MCK0198875.1 flavin reductase family protein [Ancylobacter crimeensis]